jgi:hypothetical protein
MRVRARARALKKRMWKGQIVHHADAEHGSIASILVANRQKPPRQTRSHEGPHLTPCVTSSRDDQAQRAQRRREHQLRTGIGAGMPHLSRQMSTSCQQRYTGAGVSRLSRPKKFGVAVGLAGGDKSQKERGVPRGEECPHNAGMTNMARCVVDGWRVPAKERLMG